MMLPEQEITALRALFRVAMPAADQLPPAQRADVYEGIAVAAAGRDPESFDLAARAAEDLRRAESSQLLFKSLLR